jgi:hypothetical protein
MHKKRIKWMKGVIYIMHSIDLTELLNYLMMYLIIFFICLIGSLVRDIFDSITNLNHINIKKILISVVFTSVILEAVLKYLNLSIELYVCVCFFSGMWSFKILELAMDITVVKMLLKNILKNSKNTIGESIADTIEELSDEKKAQDSTQDDNRENEG